MTDKRSVIVLLTIVKHMCACFFFFHLFMTVVHFVVSLV